MASSPALSIPSELSLRIRLALARSKTTIQTVVSINDVAVVEGNTGTTDLVFTISSAVAAGSDIQVEVDTASLLEAAAGVDYIEIVDQDVTITAGSTSASLVVTVLADTIVEINETIRADLTNVRFDGAVDIGSRHSRRRHGRRDHCQRRWLDGLDQRRHQGRRPIVGRQTSSSQSVRQRLPARISK